MGFNLVVCSSSIKIWQDWDTWSTAHHRSTIPKQITTDLEVISDGLAQTVIGYQYRKNTKQTFLLRNLKKNTKQTFCLRTSSTSTPLEWPHDDGWNVLQVKLQHRTIDKLEKERIYRSISTIQTLGIIFSLVIVEKSSKNVKIPHYLETRVLFHPKVEVCTNIYKHSKNPRKQYIDLLWHWGQTQLCIR